MTPRGAIHKARLAQARWERAQAEVEQAARAREHAMVLCAEAGVTRTATAAILKVTRSRVAHVLIAKGLTSAE
jgi:hypothetical protein